MEPRATHVSAPVAAQTDKPVSGPSAQAVRRLEIPKRGAPGKTRPLGIPSVYDRVCQRALVNRLEPIFEKVFDPSSFGYRKGRKPADALGKIWRDMGAGSE
jgi:RNA-directed DNA polymerase